MRARGRGSYVVGDVTLPPGYEPPSALLRPGGVVLRPVRVPVFEGEAIVAGIAYRLAPASRGVENCPDRLDVSAFGSPGRWYACGCGECDRPPAPTPTCGCGHRSTHQPEPGIGCTRPGCLCLEPAEPQPRPPAPPDHSWIQMERIR